MTGKYQPGDAYGDLTVLEKHKVGTKYYVVLSCSCGNEIKKRTDWLKTHTHCGCQTKKVRDQLEIGAKFGYLTITGDPVKKGTTLQVKCRCRCGVEKEMWAYDVISGATVSCGCYVLESLRNRKGQNHPLYQHGATGTTEWLVWCRVKVDCCKEWSKFELFAEWYNDNSVDGKRLVKADENFPYSPNNFRFLTVAEISRESSNPEKYHKTCVDRYGDHPSRLPLHREKVKRTSLKKYGVEHHLSSDSVRRKIENSNLERWGVKSPLSSELVREKIRETNLERYGVSIPSQSPEVKGRILETKIRNGQAHCADGKTTKDIAEEKGLAKSTVVKWIKTYGLEETLKMDRVRSGIEQSMKSALQELGVPFEEQVTIDGKYADFLVDESLVVECDGLYWHSDQILENRTYHRDRQQEYLRAGYRSLFFREDEINAKLPIVKSIIANKLGLKQQRVFARKCEIVFDLDLKGFFFENHLMGPGRGKTLSLTIDGKIVCAIQYYSTQGVNEISRFCSLRGHSVVGGFSRLISRLEKPISTFIDKRYGDGFYLPKLGFKLVSNSVSFRWVRGAKSYHRMRFSGNSGYEEGYSKIWDCGQARYTLVY